MSCLHAAQQNWQTKITFVINDLIILLNKNTHARTHTHTGW